MMVSSAPTAEGDTSTAQSLTRPSRPRWGLGAFVLVMVAYVAASVPFALLFISRSPLSRALAIAAPTVLAAGVAVLITQLRGNGARIDLQLHLSRKGVAYGLVCGFTGQLVTLPAALIYISIVGPHANSAAGQAFSGLRGSWPSAVVVFLAVVFLAPLCEEIIYRGLLWGAVERRWGRWAALAVTTVVFALTHFEPARTPLLLVVGIPIGLARLYSNSLLASIIAHQVNNLLPGTILMLSLTGILAG